MLKKMVNEAFCTLRITTTGPLLIKSGHASISGPDMTPVLTFRNGKQEAFIPGSSLKGVFRSHIEKIVCSLKSHVVCYPFEGNEERQTDINQRKRDYRDSCGGRFNQMAKNDRDRKLLENRTDLVYADSCPTCRLFGSTGFIGRIAISDAYLASTEIKEQRDGVGIDRLTGGASHGAKFELEVVSTGVIFETNIHLRNFEIWQLGMLFAVIQDMEDELIHLGSGRSRGLGQVTATISDQASDRHPGGFVISSMRDSQEPVNQIWGLGRWLNDASYGTTPDDVLNLARPVEHRERGIRRQRAFNGEALKTLRSEAIEQFIKSMQAWPTEPTALKNAPARSH
ncbi:MAG TPA: CRISPR-associated RAMP protein Csx7 [Ktedonosporobacter sp.]|jgi:CRISPR-associated RAMP protein (TIGR02581 family)|nr:CRISPR-associated RAMP protein Csx7 [Ktedonosporobacter sp.]